MNLQYTLLSPIKEDELRISFGNSRKVVVMDDPAALFAQTIAQYKRMAIGLHFWFIADPAHWLVHSAGGMLEQMTSIKQEELVGQPPEIIFSNTHPDDLPQIFAFSAYWVDYFSKLPIERKPHVHANIYVRFKNAAGVYRWIMVQYADTLIDAEQKIHYGLTFVTDVSHIKTDGVAMMSILDTYDDTCQQFFCVDGRSLTTNPNELPKISKRELEVLRYLAIGYSSKQIAAEFELSVKTIDNHRQRLLHKTKTKSTGELVGYGITMGFI